MYYLEFYYEVKLSLIMCPSVYPSIKISMDLDSKGYHLLFILLLKFSLSGLLDTPSDGSCCPFDISPSFFEHLLTLWHYKIIQDHFVFFFIPHP